MTQVGLGLAESTAEQFALLDAAMDNARAFADASGLVRIATVNTLAAYFVPPALAELKRLHPALVVRGDNVSSPEVVDQIVRGHADTGPWPRYRKALRSPHRGPARRHGRSARRA